MLESLFRSGLPASSTIFLSRSANNPIDNIGAEAANAAVRGSAGGCSVRSGSWP